jgi:hypothetical protein
MSITRINIGRIEKWKEGRVEANQGEYGKLVSGASGASSSGTGSALMLMDGNEERSINGRS